jgi:hypothetical protein
MPVYNVWLQMWAKARLIKAEQTFRIVITLWTDRSHINLTATKQPNSKISVSPRFYTASFYLKIKLCLTFLERHAEHYTVRNEATILTSMRIHKILSRWLDLSFRSVISPLSGVEKRHCNMSVTYQRGSMRNWADWLSHPSSISHHPSSSLRSSMAWRLVFGKTRYVMWFASEVFLSYV